MTSFVVTRNEMSFFILSLIGVIYLVFVAGCENITFYFTLVVVAVLLFVGFELKRKEVYFLWSIVAPRITGTAPILSNLLWMAREEGPGKGELNDLLRLDIPFMRPMFFIFKPSYLRRVLSLEATNFVSRGYTGVVTKLTGPTDNILMNEGPPNVHWARFREITSGVNRDRCGENSTLGVMFDESWKACQELTHLFDDKRGQELDLFFELFNIMVPAHNRALFGEEYASKHWYKTLGEDMYHIITENGKQLKFPISSPSKERTMMEQIKRISSAVVKMAQESNSPFILPWHEAVKKGLLTEEEFKSNLLIFEYAQAPLHVVFWVLYMLALYPEAEKRVVSEIAQVLSQGPITYTRMSEFKYLSRVITETLRLFPGVGLMQVRFNKTDCMFGNHFVPEGSYIFLSPYLIHRNATFWENPDEFDPSREGLDTTHSGEDLIHIPFGYGPRQCQGQFFAQDFMKVVLISLLQNHSIRLAPGQKAVLPTEIGFCRPEFPAYFYFSERVLPPFTPVSSGLTKAAQAPASRRSSLPLTATRRASLPTSSLVAPRRSSLPVALPPMPNGSRRSSISHSQTNITPAVAPRMPNMGRRSSLSHINAPPTSPKTTTTTTTTPITTPTILSRRSSLSHSLSRSLSYTPPTTPSPLSLSGGSPPTSPSSGRRKVSIEGNDRRSSIMSAELSEFSMRAQPTFDGEKEVPLLVALAKRRRSVTTLSQQVAKTQEPTDSNAQQTSSPPVMRRRRSISTTVRGMPATYTSVYSIGVSRKLSKVASLRKKSLIFRESFKTRAKKNANKKKDRHELLILWGSQSGRSHSFALRLAHMAKMCKISCSCLCMSMCDVESIPKYKSVVVVTSTYGDGGPPENAEMFCEWLEHDHPSDLWRGVKYAVMSLGSSLYSLPFEFGNFVSSRFSQLGAQQLIEDCKLDDEKYDDAEDFRTWSLKLFENITSSHEGDKAMKQALLVARNKVLGFQKFDFNLLNPPFDLEFGSDVLEMEYRVKYSDNVIMATVDENNLVSTDPTNQIYSINLKISENSMNFQPGDNIAVMPNNDIDLVRKLVSRLGYPGDIVFNIEDTTVDTIAAGDHLSCSLGENKCTLEIALSYYYDVTQWMSKTLLQFFALNCTDETDQDTLLGYASDFHSFLQLEYTPADVLEMFPSIQLRSEHISDEECVRNLAVFLGLLKPLRARPYSVASSPLVSSDSVRLVYKVVEYVGKEGQEKHGLCSSWLQARKPGDEVAISLSRSRFRLPANDDVPIIMVGAGTGISPYFGFLEHREALAQKLNRKFGKSILIHGCRSEADFPYREKLDDVVKEGMLTHLWPAYSREEGVASAYVQDVIDRESTLLWQLINNEGAVIYSCGDIKIGISVKEAYVKLVQKCGELDERQAKEYVQKLCSNGRFRHDEWGTSLSEQA